MKVIKIEISSEIPENYTGIAEYPNGDKYWFKEGKYHRLDGPVFEWANGYKRYYLEGVFYRQVDLKDFVVLDHYQGKYGIIWYKLLDENEILEHPDIPGLIEK
jgi:hypothetical protein